MSDDTPSPLRERVAEEIRVQLARRNISAAELARRTGYKQPYLSRRMVGEVAWDLDDLQRIAAALDVEVSALLPTTAKAKDINSSYAPPARTVTAGGRTNEPAELVTTAPAVVRPTPCHTSGRPPRTATGTISAPRSRQAWRTT